MGDIGHEVPLSLPRGFYLLGHDIEAAGQATHLLGGGNVELLVKIASRYLLSSRGDALQRLGNRAGDEEGELEPHRHRLPLLHLACLWNLAQPGVQSVIPTLIQEADPAGKPIESKVDELAALPEQKLSAEDCQFILEAGNNQGCMALKGANRSHTGEPEADHWGLTPDLEAVGKRWGIDPDRDLVCTHTKAA